jgi:hypothetical protein
MNEGTHATPRTRPRLGSGCHLEVPTAPGTGGNFEVTTAPGTGCHLEVPTVPASKEALGGPDCAWV